MDRESKQVEKVMVERGGSWREDKRERDMIDKSIFMEG